MKKLYAKFARLGDKTVTKVAAVVATLATDTTLLLVDEMSMEVGLLILANAWLIVEALNYKED